MGTVAITEEEEEEDDDNLDGARGEETPLSTVRAEVSASCSNKQGVLQGVETLRRLLLSLLLLLLLLLLLVEVAAEEKAEANGNKQVCSR